MRGTELEGTTSGLVLDRNRLRTNYPYIHRKTTSTDLVKEIMSRENGNISILFPYSQ